MMGKVLAGKVALAAIGTAGAAALLVQSAAYAGYVYPQCLKVQGVKHVMPDDCYVLTLADCAGHQYTYTADDGDVQPGDLMSAIMDSMGTFDDVTDDDVLAVRYSGFHVEGDDNAE